jgi:tetratricopeptide (TPR) repeat protein
VKAAVTVNQSPGHKPPIEHERELIQAAQREAAELVERSARTLPPPDAVPGFRIISEIGRGGMGVVYKALQLSTNRIVALKVMVAGPFASATARQRFRREVELAARFQHPGIVRVLEGGETSTGQPFYAMDCVQGIQLGQWFSRTQPDVPTTLRLFLKLCEAVDYAHQQGVVHRDLKPANVLVDTEGKPRILDFGLCKATDGQTDALTICTSSGQIMGTLPYLSPEQTSGSPDDIDARTDLYALGVVLYEGLTGALPFEMDKTPSKTISRIQEDPPVAPSSLTDQIDADLQTIVLKALEKEKARRYPSVREMAADIERYLNDEPIHARPATRLYRTRKKMYKHRLGIGAVVGAVAVGLLLFGMGDWWRQRAADSRQARILASARREILVGDICLELRVDGTLEQIRDITTRCRGLREACLLHARAEHFYDYTYVAISALRAAITKNEGAWAERMLLANIYRDQGREDRALELEEACTFEPPDTAEAWYLRSFTTLDRSRAIQCLRRSAELDSGFDLAEERLALLHFADRDYAKSLGHTETLLEIRRDDSYSLYIKGYVLLAMGHYDQAVEVFTDIIGRWPDAYRAHRFRAHAHLGAGDYDGAQADLRKAWELQNLMRGSASSWLLFQRITPLWMLGRLEEAAEVCEAAHEGMLTPTYADARRYIILRSLGRREEADHLLNKARRAKPRPWLGKIFDCLAGELDPHELAEAADSEEQRCEGYYYAGEACLLQQRQQEALAWFQRCVDFDLSFDPNTWPPEPMNEFELARWRLASLSSVDKTALRPETE